MPKNKEKIFVLELIKFNHGQRTADTLYCHKDRNACRLYLKDRMNSTESNKLEFLPTLFKKDNPKARKGINHFLIKQIENEYTTK